MSQHLIARCAWQTTYDDESQGVALQNGLSEFSRTQLPQLLEQVFDAHVPPERTLRLDQLVLDIGSIDYANLQQELPKKIVAALTQKFQEKGLFRFSSSDNVNSVESCGSGSHAEAGHQTDDNPHSDAGQSPSQGYFEANTASGLSPSTSHSRLELVSQFLQSGRLPWWSSLANRPSEVSDDVFGDMVSGTPLETFQALIQRHPEAVRQLLIAIGKQPQVRKRLIWQWQEIGFTETVTVLQPHYNREVIALTKALPDLVSTALTALNQPHLKGHDWLNTPFLWALSWVLDNPGPVNVRQFVSFMLAQFTQTHKLEYAALLRQLVKESDRYQHLAVLTRTLQEILTKGVFEPLTEHSPITISEPNTDKLFDEASNNIAIKNSPPSLSGTLTSRNFIQWLCSDNTSIAPFYPQLPQDKYQLQQLTGFIAPESSEIKARQLTSGQKARYLERLEYWADHHGLEKTLPLLLAQWRDRSEAQAIIWLGDKFSSKGGIKTLSSASIPQWQQTLSRHVLHLWLSDKLSRVTLADFIVQINLALPVSTNGVTLVQWLKEFHATSPDKLPLPLRYWVNESQSKHQKNGQDHSGSELVTDLVQIHQPIKPNLIEQHNAAKTDGANQDINQTETSQKSAGEQQDAGSQNESTNEPKLSESEKPKSETIEALFNKPRHKKDISYAVNNAGIVLLQSYIAVYFERLKLLDNRQFQSTESRQQAVHFLQYLVSGQSRTEEQYLLLNKVLCGMPMDEPLLAGIDINNAQQELAQGLLQAMIQHWSANGSSTIDGFRGNWLVRDGVLAEREEAWELTVEHRPYDLLLQRSPFSFGIIKLPWMTKMLQVNWAY